MAKKSFNVKSEKKAIGYLDGLTSIDAVNTYVDGDQRVAVLKAADERIAVLKKESKAQVDAAINAERSSEDALAASSENPAKSESKSKVEIAAQDTWKYHREHEPRIFKQGEVIPKGWTGPEGIMGKVWTMDAFGKFTKVAEEKS